MNMMFEISRMACGDVRVTVARALRKVSTGHSRSRSLDARDAANAELAIDKPVTNRQFHMQITGTPIIAMCGWAFGLRVM